MNDAPPAGDARAPAWRLLAVLQEHVGEGVAVAPVLEAVDDLRGEARIVAAVFRAGREPALTVELWSLRSGGEAAIFAPIGAPEAILRLREDDPRPGRGSLDRLRQFMATPGTAVIRPRGLGGTPEALLDALAAAAREARDPSAAGEVRARAIATLIRGLDDALVLGRDAVWAVIAAVEGGRPVIAAREPLGPRRSRITTAGPAPTSMMLLSLPGGWVVGELAPASSPPAPQGASGSAEPAAEPSPTAP